jgi:hypothetical protein
MFPGWLGSFFELGKIETCVLNPVVAPQFLSNATAFVFPSGDCSS